MKNIIGVLLVAVVFGCTLAGNGDKSADLKAINCDKPVSYGDIQVCLPAINGMVESYGIPNVKVRADAFQPDVNVVLGFYLNDATHKEVDSLDNLVLDDYFQIYAAKSLQGVKVTAADLDKMGDIVSDNYIKENWDDLNEKIKKEFDFLSVTKPILLDSYTPNPDARAYILLLKYEVEDDFQIYIATMNVLKIRDRMLFMAYYKSFKNEETITDAKEKNNKIVEAFIKANA